MCMLRMLRMIRALTPIQKVKVGLGTAAAALVAEEIMYEGFLSQVTVKGAQISGRDASKIASEMIEDPAYQKCLDILCTNKSVNIRVKKDSPCGILVDRYFEALSYNSINVTRLKGNPFGYVYHIYSGYQSETLCGILTGIKRLSISHASCRNRSCCK